MTEHAKAMCDAIAARLWDCLPKLLEGLPGDVVHGSVSEELVRDLARQLSRAITAPAWAGIEQPPEALQEGRSDLEELASLAFDIERALRKARDCATDLSDSVEVIASRAFDAERSLRDSQGWVIGIDEQIGALRRR